MRQRFQILKGILAYASAIVPHAYKSSIANQAERSI